MIHEFNTIAINKTTSGRQYKLSRPGDFAVGDVLAVRVADISSEDFSGLSRRALWAAEAKAIAAGRFTLEGRYKVTGLGNEYRDDETGDVFINAYVEAL
ncbi:MAG: hypothetical protein REI09_05145 [Candidatus Dactylopiibacterium sp.]|nr:hypothetical protein [Candidatus Dactylopiibacterium sp.]